MPVQAQWHSDLHVGALEELWEPERIEEVGTPIHLGAAGEEARLNAALLDTIRQEVELADHGQACNIRQADDTNCHACALYRAVDAVCQLGRRQEKILTDLRVIRLGGRR